MARKEPPSYLQNDSIIPVSLRIFIKSCVDQVLALTTYIEAGFQNQQETSTVFVDLTVAYDIVRGKGLLFKFIKLIPRKPLGRALE